MTYNAIDGLARDDIPRASELVFSAMTNPANQIQTWIDGALDKRATLFSSEVAFYLYLVEGERKACPWRGAYPSFEALLKEHNLCHTPRYTNFKNAVATITGGAKTAHSVGVDGLIEAARVQDAEKQAKVILTLTETSRDRRGVPAAQEEVRRICQSIAPVERTPRRLKRALARPSLEQENATLRKRVRELEAENARLKTKIAKLERQRAA